MYFMYAGNLMLAIYLGERTLHKKVLSNHEGLDWFQVQIHMYIYIYISSSFGVPPSPPLLWSWSKPINPRPPVWNGWALVWG